MQEVENFIHKQLSLVTGKWRKKSHEFSTDPLAANEFNELESFPYFRLHSPQFHFLQRSFAIGNIKLFSRINE